MVFKYPIQEMINLQLVQQNSLSILIGGVQNLHMRDKNFGPKVLPNKKVIQLYGILNINQI